MKVVVACAIALTCVQARADEAGMNDFLAGKRTTYSSAQDPKARGIDLTFDHPASWAGKPGRSPHTLYDVSSERGKGSEVCNLSVTHIDGPPPMKQDLDATFSPSGLRAFVPEGATYLSSRPMSIQSQPAAQVEYETTLERGSAQVRARAVSWTFYHRGAMLSFGCMVFDRPDNPKARVDTVYAQSLPLYTRMANSMVLHR